MDKETVGNPRVDFDLAGFDQVSNPRKRDVALLPMAYPKGLTEHACTALDPLLHLCLAVTQCSGGHQHTIGVSLFLMPLSSWYYRPIYSDIRNGSRSGLGLRLKSESPRHKPPCKIQAHWESCRGSRPRGTASNRSPFAVQGRQHQASVLPFDGL